MTEPAASADGPKLDRRVVRTRAAVLAAGRELYDEQGASAITIEEIVRRTGIAKTTIYRQWRSREELVIAILEDSAVKLPAIHTDDPIRDARKVLLSLWKHLATPTSRSGLVSTIESTIANPEMASRHRDFLTGRQAPLVDAVARAIEAGVVQPDARAQTLADLLASPVIVRALIRGDAPDRRYVDHLIRTVLDITTPRDSRSRSSRDKH